MFQIGLQCVEVSLYYEQRPGPLGILSFLNMSIDKSLKGVGVGDMVYNLRCFL